MKNTASLLYFVNAIREVLGLDPIGRGNRRKVRT